MPPKSVIASDSSASRAYCNDDILRLICEILDYKLCAQLAQTTRRGFDIAIPFAWSEVYGHHYLFKLLANVKICQHDEETVLEIKPFTAANSARFNIYAPFIKSLTMFGGYLPKVLPWQLLLSQSQRASLLPNLKSLGFMSSRNVDVVLWTSILVSPSLETVTYDWGCSMPLSAASGLAMSIAQRCPDLKHLVFDIDISRSNYETDVSAVEGAHIALLQAFSGSLHSHFLYMSNLSSVSINLGLLDNDLLLSLSKMPNLKELKFTHPSSSWSPPTVGPKPKTCFASLRSLTLGAFVLETIHKVWDFTPLLQHLEYLSLTVDYGERDSTFSTIMASFFPLLCTHSPHLLRLCIQPYCWDEDTCSRVDPNGLLECMSQLPLQKISWDHIGFTCPYPPGLSDAWPHMTELHLPHHRIHAKDLYNFARLPNLRHLTLSVWSNSWDACSIPTHTATLRSLDPMINRTRFQTLELHVWQWWDEDGGKGYGNTFTASSVQKVARYLLWIWPNILQVKHDGPTSQLSVVCLEFLNVHLAMLQRERAVLK